VDSNLKENRMKKLILLAHLDGATVLNERRCTTGVYLILGMNGKMCFGTKVVATNKEAK
jgi:hypothetical protein